VKRYKPGFGTAKNGVWTVILVEGLKDDDLFIRINDGQKGGDHAFGRPAADRDFCLRIHTHPVVPGKFLGNALAQGWGSPGYGILVHIGIDGLHRRFLNL
jgi:hypothetical protein